MDMTRQQLSQIIAAHPGRNVGHTLARRFECTFGLPINSLDSLQGGTSELQKLIEVSRGLSVDKIRTLILLAQALRKKNDNP